MALAAIHAKVPPHEISFKATMQALNNFLPLLAEGKRCQEPY
jgi:hypothetical protein